MMPLMSLTSLLNILRPARTPAPHARAPGDDHIDDNVYVDPQAAQGSGTGGHLVARDGRTLPLRGVSLRADARGGVVRVVLEQRFVNPYQEPLHVTYLMPLPADAAVSGYAFALAGRRIVGEIDRKKQARQRFEQAILEGKTAGIVEQERSSLFTQELGNVPAAAEVVAELTIDQKLVWRREGLWEWRFPTTVGPRYLGSPGQVPDAARLEVPVMEAGTPARLALALTIRDAMAGGVRPQSPSHRLRSSAAGASFDVQLADEDGARLDRDVVVRWPAVAEAVGTSLDVGRPTGQRQAYGLLTLVPPAPARQRPARRDLILLLDTSGSMDGEPMRQLQRTSLALIDSLGEQDTLEMIEFSSSARRWHRAEKAATSQIKREARAWIEGLRAGGGTEMVSGMIEALTPLTERSQRQVILMTDGYIGQESVVISQVMTKLPRGSSRIHVVGVGSSVNRTLTAGVARAGAGVELIIGPGEDAERLVSGLLARTAAPLVTHVEVRGAALLANAPAFLPDLYAGSPALISLQLRPEGGQLELSGFTADGPWRTQVAVPACDEGQGTVALAQLFARETVEDLELAYATRGDKKAEIDREIEELGLRYQISTRLTTWVAVSQEATVDPSNPGRREAVPHEVPYGTSVSGLGLRQAAAAPVAMYNLSPSANIPSPSARPVMLGGTAAASSGVARAEMRMRSPLRRSEETAGSAERSAPRDESRGGFDEPSGSLYGSAGSAGSDEDDTSSFDELESLSAPAAGFSPPPPPAAAPAPPAFPYSMGARSAKLEAPAGAPAEAPAKDSAKADASDAGEAKAKKRAEADEAPRARAPMPMPRQAPGPLAAPMFARLRHRSEEGKVVLEIVLSAELRWSPGDRVTVRLAGGREIEALVRAGTTGAGTYQASQVLRLVIDLGAAVAGVKDAELIAVLTSGRLFPIVME